MIGHLDAGLPRLLAALLVRLLRALLVRDLVADLARDVHTHLHHPRVTTRALKVFSCSVHVSVCSHRDQAHCCIVYLRVKLVDVAVQMIFLPLTNVN